MLKGIDAIAEANPDVPPVGDVPDGPSGAPRKAKPGANGYVPDIVVLLTDGANNRGIEPLDAVPYAVERRRPRVHDRLRDREPRRRSRARATSSAATASTPTGSAGRRLRRGRFGGGGFGGGGGGFRRGADIPTLQAVAKRTGGTYHGAEDADQLREVFADLPKEVATQKERSEITWIFAAVAGLLAVAAIAASMRWSTYP